MKQSNLETRTHVWLGDEVTVKQRLPCARDVK